MQLKRAIPSALSGATIAVLAMWACGPPPIGYTGAGRMTGLPAFMEDAGGAMGPVDAGLDVDEEAGFDATSLETGAPHLDAQGMSSSTSSPHSSSSSSSVGASSSASDAGMDSGSGV